MTTYYFDHAASAPRREVVTAAMAPWLHGVVANPSGAHHAARAAQRALEDAREAVAGHLGARPGEVIFTAGGTESCQLAVAGRALWARRTRGRARLVVSAIEHHAVLDAADWAVRNLSGVSVERAPVDRDGRVTSEGLARLLDEETALVSVMTANNETGVLEPLEAVRDAAARVPGCATHTDAVAAAPWLDLARATAGFDLVSVCAHKIGGPVNAGALVVRGAVGLDALVPGGGQERGRRGGTVDVASAVGLAAALEGVARERAVVAERVGGYRERLGAALGALEGVRVTAGDAVRLPGTLHLTVEGVASDELLFVLDRSGVCASAAASCSSGASGPSHVLAAMGVDGARARGSLRLSMGAETTSDEVDAVIGLVTAAIERLRSV
ncbi:MAG TPA: aminotransferase class V-fold PLP-dependent enzyme [Acidimicrobiales bacterium]|nr:MAG: hypothetical protein B7Z69_01595 [Actinobacteria bacterium 21-73-9]HQU25837.1 aminotransferase class V-fold PLP-dependent enzyme [Acidimicrobiales bacterium]